MSASCEMIIKVTGSDEDFEKIIQKLLEVEGPPSFKSPSNVN